VAPLHASVFTEGVYSRDMGRGNSREGGGRGAVVSARTFSPARRRPLRRSRCGRGGRQAAKDEENPVTRDGHPRFPAVHEPPIATEQECAAMAEEIKAAGNEAFAAHDFPLAARRCAPYKSDAHLFPAPYKSDAHLFPAPYKSDAHLFPAPYKSDAHLFPAPYKSDAHLSPAPY
jgi:hypothetical protein